MDLLSERSRISAEGTTGTSGTLSGEIIDFASNGGAESALGIAWRSASQADAVLCYQAGSASDALSDTTGDVSGKSCLYLDVYRPHQRYGRFQVRAGSATIAAVSLVTHVYGARKVPTTQPASSTGARITLTVSGTATG
jgi:hypothetical protein